MFLLNPMHICFAWKVSLQVCVCARARAHAYKFIIINCCSREHNSFVFVLLNVSIHNLYWRISICAYTNGRICLAHIFHVKICCYKLFHHFFTFLLAHNSELNIQLLLYSYFFTFQSQCRRNIYIIEGNEIKLVIQSFLDTGNKDTMNLSLYSFNMKDF